MQGIVLPKPIVPQPVIPAPMVPPPVILPQPIIPQLDLASTTAEFIAGFDQFGQVGQSAVLGIPSIQNAIALINQIRVPSATTVPVARNSGGPVYLARGGFVNTMLTPGEMVFDPKFTAKNLSTLMQMNRSARPKGTDTVQAILPAGSFVLNKGAVEKYFAGGGYLPYTNKLAQIKEEGRNKNKNKERNKEYQQMLDALLNNDRFAGAAFDYFGSTAEPGEFSRIKEMWKQMAEGFNTGGKVEGIGKHSVQYLRTGGMTLDPTIIPQMRGTIPVINKSATTNISNQANANTNQNVTINLQGSNISTEQQAIQLGKAFQRQIRLGRLK